ncbi:hypothetical protein [Undibacterium curvum]|uniref:Uncharacterized protein n=1 Tax=Undibacterium curvum TaxID=2762294 RepID=A0ABR7A0D7_9BURK|nr:hypothetical protein [Undibacterium curvum]MBC3930371.1 hypothetical protein [Undibacterium curvum]
MIGALFVRKDSIYKRLPGVDCYDIERDARKYAATGAVVAHPPCRAWGQLAHMAKPRPDEKELALFAVKKIREVGGVLEHPAKSRLWAAAGLPQPGERDEFGGFSIVVNQHWWGHRAEKKTILYIVGIEPCELPEIPFVMGEAPCVVASAGRRKDGTRSKRRPEITKREREATPDDFAVWLLEVARKCQVRKS